MRLVVQIETVGNQLLQLDFRESFERSAATATGPALMSGASFAATWSSIWTTVVTTRAALAAATIAT